MKAHYVLSHRPRCACETLLRSAESRRLKLRRLYSDGPGSPVPNGPSDAQLRIPGSIPQEKETPLRNLLPLKTGNPFSSDPRYSRFSFPLILSYHKVATVVFRHLPANTANFSNFNNFFHFFGYRPVNQLARMGRCLFTRPLPVLLYAQERIILPDQYRYNQTDHYFRSDPRQEYRS